MATDNKNGGEARAFYHQMYAGITSGLGAAVMVFAMNFPTFGVPSMLRDPDFDITIDQSTLVGSLVPAAGIVGHLAAGIAVERVGRKKTLLLGGLGFAVALPLLAATSSVRTALLARALCGVAGSLVLIAGMILVTEVAHPSVRDRIGSFIGVLANAGMLTAFVLGSMYEWRQVTWCGLLMVLPMLGMLLVISESPLYYIKQGKMEEALSSLKWYRATPSAANKELKELVASTRKTEDSSMSFGDMFKLPYSTPVLTTILMLVTQQLTGITAITAYAVDIFKAIGSSIDPAYCTVMIGIVNIISTLVGAEIHSRFNRKPTFLVTTMVCVNMEIFLGFFYWAKESGHESLREWTGQNSHLALASMLVFYVSFTIGLGVMPFMYMGEALPSKIKGHASALALTLNMFIIVFIMQTFKSLVGLLGYHFLFLLMATLTFVCALYVYTLMIETKNKTISQIDDYYNALIKKKKN